MIWLVCINRDQGDSVVPMLRATESFGDNRIIVLDRSPEISGEGFRHRIINLDGNGFQAGRMRDLGREYVERIDPGYTGILFIDGDRIPLDNLLDHCHGDAMLFSCEQDARGELWAVTDVTDKCYRPESPFYSMAVYLSRRVIDSCKEDGRLFAACFDGLWGDEDRDLGDRVIAAGFRIQGSPLRVSGSWVDRYKHGADDRNYRLRLKRRDYRQRGMADNQCTPISAKVSQMNKAVAFSPELVKVFLDYLSTRPHGEVRNLVQAIESSPAIELIANPNTSIPSEPASAPTEPASSTKGSQGKRGGRK